MARLHLRGLILLALLTTGASAQSTPERSGTDDARTEDALFPRPVILRPRIAFWTNVFGHYSRRQSVIHSAAYPERVLEVLDFRDQALTKGRGQVSRAQSLAEGKTKTRYRKLLLSVHAKQRSGAPLSGEERRVYDLFAGIDDPDRFRRAAAEVRAQRGVKERTAAALQSSGKYLPEMEAIFEREGLPRRLTRLPLVESSFNEAAASGAGAKGIWQFMPSSARIYMRLNKVVDDRADPWFSTKAAARHLKDDYALLGDWSLAVTAYNHGRAGVAKGLRVVQGNSLADLIERYRNPRFGFASSNFYAEFLAASDVERAHEEFFGRIERQAPVRFDEVKTERGYIPYRTLVRLSGSDEKAFRQLNPSYRKSVISGKLYVPPGHTVRLPPGAATAFRTSLAALGASELYDRQRIEHRGAHNARKGHTRRDAKLVKVKATSSARRMRTHRVRAGETLSQLAARYGVSTASLRRMNRLRHAGHIRAGQKLRIPRS